MKTFWIIVGTIFAIALIFCLGTLIASSINGVSFAEEIKSWFEVAEETTDVVEPVVASIFRK